MKKVIFLLISLSTTAIISQSSNKKWSFGGGVSNFKIVGDLSSNDKWNIGSYLFLDKMFTEHVGIELKISATKTSGGGQITSSDTILYVPTFNQTEYVYFKGNSANSEINFIYNLNSLFKNLINNLDLKLYIGHHTFF